MGSLIQFLIVSGFVALTVALTHSYGLVCGLALIAGIVILTSALAAGLLKSSALNQVTWKNRAAGLLLPWGRLVGGGSLTSLIAKNGAASLGVAILVVMVDHWNLLEPAPVITDNAQTTKSWQPTILVWLTAFGWLVFSAGWSLLMLSYLKNRSEPISTLVMRKSRITPLLLPPVAVGVSVTLRYLGWYWLALAVVWIPLTAIFLPVILMLLTIVVFSLLGKPIRWN